jgi:hypothetical protein
MEIGDLIIDDDDGAIGFIIEILPNDKVLEAEPDYKVHWFGGFETFAGPISTETSNSINFYRKLS